MNFSNLLGHFVLKIDTDKDSYINIYTINSGEVNKFRLYHSQDCCEQVYIADIEGDLKNLEGGYISHAEESSCDVPKEEAQNDVHIWTFYKLAANNEWVDIRWSGSSNGYYSTSVTFNIEEITQDEKLKALAGHEVNIINQALGNSKNINHTIYKI